MFGKFAILFAFLAMFSWGVGDFLIQRTVKKIGEFETLIWINLIGGLGLLPFVIGDFSKLHWGNVWPLILLGVIDFFYGITLLKAYDRGKLSVVEIIMTVELPFTVLLGMSFFKEKLTLPQTLLILLILSGIIFISKSPATLMDKLVKFFTGRAHRLEKGVILAVIAAFISGFYNFMVAFNARDISAVMAIWFPWTMSFLCLFVYVLFKKGFKTFINKSKKEKGMILITGLIDTLAWISFSIALSKNELSITTAITESYPAIAMFLGIKYNREKISGSQYFGAVAALMGSVIIGII